ncbi:MAG TPA: NAD(P)-dependent oxidoreductase [Pyrinomonadaceae bacterium]|jgi:nucleoside-diphosphate-sugar epimerase|nr:NAD(P)-dependent oxidoreductase [Pyrinomonadaceae bacterium]
MKVLVTGGSGYLGIHVRRFFDADDFSRRVGLDILDPYDASRAAEYDAVIHLAAHLDKSNEAAAECFRTNAEGTANLLTHMREGAIFIYASTKDVYGSHADSYLEVSENCSTDYCGQSPLEWSKLIGERYVEYYAATRSLRACIFRLSAVYARPSEGNESNFVTHYVEAVKRGWPLRLPASGQPMRDILHVEDFARACRAFIDSGLARGTYNLGGGREQATTLRGIVETVGRLIQLEPVIDEAASVPAPVPFNYVSDLSLVRSELGWQPLIGIEEGLRSLL